MIKIILITCLVLLTSCGKANVGFSPIPGVRLSVPISLPSISKSSTPKRLPSGNGGYRKTGKPYKIQGQWYYPLETSDGYDARGVASWYGKKFHGKKTANGERYDMYTMSAAHKTLPLPTMARVTNLENGKSVIVRINDRGPFAKSRIIDLSYAAARALDYDQKGTARVRVEALADNAKASDTKTRQQPPTPPAKYIQRNATSPVATPSGSGQMYIQLGAFSSRVNALKLADLLTNDYPSTEVYTKPGATVFRVRMGPFQNVEEIESIVSSLKQDGQDNAIVIIE
ncbi:MAG: septal ring lytic transglycosylase RlpA family protein [Mariprofundaceae bacterium]